MKIDPNRTSDSYIATYDLSCDTDKQSIDSVRKTVITMNKWLREAGSDAQYYVHLRGRGHRQQKRKFCQDLPLKYAQTADLYVKQRNPLGM